MKLRPLGEESNFDTGYDVAYMREEVVAAVHWLMQKVDMVPISSPDKYSIKVLIKMAFADAWDREDGAS